MKFTVVIPARYASSRLPAKPLVDIGGKPMIQWVYEQSLKSGAEKVIIATDDQRIVDAVKAFGGEVCLTSQIINRARNVWLKWLQSTILQRTRSS